MDPLPRRLHTPRLLLRCPEAGDGAAANAAIRESWPELTRWMDWASGDPPLTEETEERMAQRPDAFAALEDFSFGIWHRETAAFVGMLSLFALDWSVPKGEIGYWLRTRFVGQGLLTEAARAVVSTAFSTLGLARIEIRCDAKNRRSAAVAQRLGFVLEGRLRNECRDPQGNLRDTLLFAQVPGDPAANQRP